jgi:4-amino-4-deoxy-L-arabinose transferase-like glycosyltransferase
MQASKFLGWTTSVAQLETSGKKYPFFLASLIVLIAKLPTLNNSIIFIDEPIYITQAMRLNSVEAFVYAFQYRVETKFQLGLLPYVISTTISLPNTLLFVHLFGLVATLASGILLIAISQRMFKRYSPGLVAVFLWCLFFYTDELAAATLLEVFQTPLLLLSVWLFLPVLQNSIHPRRLLFWSGFSLGLATLVKPPGLLMLPILGLALILPPNPVYKLLSKKFILASLILLIGFAIPLVLFIIPYLFNAEALAALNLCLFQIASQYITTYGPNQNNVIRALKLLILFGNFYFYLMLTSLMSLIYFKLKSRWNWHETDRYLLLLGLSGTFLFVGYSVGQAKTHYLLAVLPFFLLVVGYQLSKNLEKLKLVKRVMLYTFLISLCLIILANNVHYYLNLYSYNGVPYANTQPNINISSLASYIDANTNAQDSIYVYYNVPEIYWKAQRHPAGTEPTGTFLVDFYNQFWFKRVNAELIKDRPTMIIGIDNPRDQRPQVADLMALPVIGNLLKQRYTCSRDLFPSTTICKLNS